MKKPHPIAIRASELGKARDHRANFGRIPVTKEVYRTTGPRKILFLSPACSPEEAQAQYAALAANEEEPEHTATPAKSALHQSQSSASGSSSSASGLKASAEAKIDGVSRDAAAAQSASHEARPANPLIGTGRRAGGRAEEAESNMLSQLERYAPRLVQFSRMMIGHKETEAHQLTAVSQEEMARMVIAKAQHLVEEMQIPPDNKARVKERILKSLSGDNQSSADLKRTGDLLASRANSASNEAFRAAMKYFAVTGNYTLEDMQPGGRAGD